LVRRCINGSATVTATIAAFVASCACAGIASSHDIFHFRAAHFAFDAGETHLLHAHLNFGLKVEKINLTYCLWHQRLWPQ